MINQRCSLVLHDLFSYDIQSCYPNILQNISYELKNINLEDKDERSKYIGKQQIDNENLSSFLIESTENLIKSYIRSNGLTEEDLIVTQRDGFITTKILTKTNISMELKLREIINVLILSLDRKAYISFSDNGLTVKGVRDYYESLNVFYNEIQNFNYYNKNCIFQQMQNVKNNILNHDNKETFCIPRNNKCVIVTKSDGPVEVSNSSLVQIEDIDKIRYFNHYFKPFFDSLFLTSY